MATASHQVNFSLVCHLVKVKKKYITVAVPWSHAAHVCLAHRHVASPSLPVDAPSGTRAPPALET